MTERALLLVAHAAHAAQRVGGMTVLERQLWTMKRAGLKKVWVGMPRPAGSPRLPDGLEIVWADSGAAAQLNAEPPYLAVSGDYFIRVETLRYVVEQTYPASVTLEDASGASVLQVTTTRADHAVPPVKQPLPAGAAVRLLNPVNNPDTMRWLMALGVKPQDGFMARHFDRFISLSVSRTLLDTPVTPNMMTVISSIIGLAGASLFLVPSHVSRMTGAAMIWLHSVLDGCDGELARIRFEESPIGGALDFWGDNVVHVALFSCMAYGFYRADHGPLPLILGAIAAVGTLGSALLNYKERVERWSAPTEGGVAWLARLEHMLAARDFIYLLLILAYLDRLYEFMWATAVGSLLFFFMMMYLGRKQNEQTVQPHPAR